MIPSASPNELSERLARLEKRLDALLADLANGVPPKKIAARQVELAQLLSELSVPLSG